MSTKKPHWEEEGPEPNPVTQIITTRTLQTVAAILPVLIVLHRVLPPDRFRRLLWASGPVVAASLSTYFAATFHAQSPFFSALAGRKNGFITRLPPGVKNAVAFTFDDGPHPDSTPLLLDMLKEQNAKATFFLVGERASQYPEIVRRIAQEGHGIGIHGLRHRNMVLQKPEQVRKEIKEAVWRIEKAAGISLPLPYLLRPPYGFKTPSLARTAIRLGCRIIAWSLDPHDYDTANSGTIIARVDKNIQPGDILLLHERPEVNITVQALPSLLLLCRDRGLELQTLSPPLLR
jgi:peptidoglycan/xylan/chitin deacetylase (PgdA/CDA1 family)